MTNLKTTLRLKGLFFIRLIVQLCLFTSFKDQLGYNQIQRLEFRWTK